MSVLPASCGCLYHTDGFDNDHELVQQCLQHQGKVEFVYLGRPAAPDRPWSCRLGLHSSGCDSRHPAECCLRCGYRMAYTTVRSLPRNEQCTGASNHDPIACMCAMDNVATRQVFK